MTIKPVTYYQHECDCCHAVADYGDYSAWSNWNAADDNFPDHWAEIDGKHYCEDCWTDPDDTAENDDPVPAHTTHPEATA